VQVHVHGRHAEHEPRNGRGLPVTARCENTPETVAESTGYTPRPARDIALSTGFDAAETRADPRRIAPSFRCKPARDIAIDVGSILLAQSHGCDLKLRCV